MARKAKKTFHITGRVLDRKSEQGAANLRVEAWDKDAIIDDFVGSAVTREGGIFEIKFDQSHFRELFSDKQPDLYFKVFSDDKLIKSTEDSVLWNVKTPETEIVIEVNLPAEKPEPDGKPQPFKVAGLIRRVDGTPMVGTLVRAFDKDLRSEECLNETTTDEAGRYEITYAAAQFRRAEKSSADLRISVCNEDGRELVSSAIIFNARPEETVDLTVGGEYRGPSEYEAMIAEITPVLQGVPLHELTEQDITFLAGDTGLEAQRLTWLAESAKLARETEIPSEAFYAWFRDGQPQQFAELIRRSTDLLMASLDNAVRQHYIPELDESLKDMLHQVLDSRRVDEVLKPAGDGAPASLGDVLRTLPLHLALEPSQQFAVAKVLQEDSRPEISLAERLRDVGIEEKQIWGIERTLGLQKLTQSHLPLMQALQLEEIDSASATLRDLARYDAADWHGLVVEHGVPSTIQAEDDAQRQNLYADQLAASVENLHPSEWIAVRIESDRFPVNDAIKSDVQTFLRQNPQFQVGKTSTLRYFDDPDTVVLEGISDVKGVKDEMLKMERIVNCCPRLAIAGKTLKEGFGSAHAIALVSRERFNAAITAGNPELQSQADDVYQRAVQANARAVAIATEYIRAERGTPLAIMQPRPQTTTSALAANGNSQTADLRTLFGNLDFCECEHCSSVYSPAAYLVDLMQVLDGGARNGFGYSPLDILLFRRLDLAEIDLTCENTNTTVPYIDLVLEVLEQAVLSGRGAYTSTTNFSLDVGQNEVDDLRSGQIPSKVIEILQQNLLTSFKQATVQSISSNTWAIRISGWKINATARPGFTSTSFFLFLRCWPQTSGTATQLSAVPHFIAPEPYTDHLRNVVHPWTLPFDLWREETNVWLRQLGIERHALMAAFAGNDRYSDFDTAIEFLGFSLAEAEKLTAAVDGWRVWGFDNATAITTEIKDPIGGGSFKPSGSDKTWVGALSQRASLLRHRAGLTQRELMNSLETYFVQGAAFPNKLQLIGDECDASKMNIPNLNEKALKRIHLFVRLWRKLGWSMPDLDRAHIAKQALNTADDTLNRNFLMFLANLERLRKQTKLPLGILLNWYTPTLSTQQYADFSGSQPRILPSTYEELFYDRSVARPKDAAFELNGTRDELVSSDPTETVRSKISVIAAALGVKPIQIEMLLPPVRDSLGLADFAGPTDGIGIDHLGAEFPTFELDIRQIRGAEPKISVKLQHADLPSDPADEPVFEDIHPNSLHSNQQPAEITNQTRPGLQRFTYTDPNSKPLLRIAITEMTGSDLANNPPRIRMAGKIILSPVVFNLTDDLTLANLSALSRYTSLAKALRISTKDLMLAIDLTGINPFHTTPEQTLKFIDRLQLIQSVGFSLADLDYLLRHLSLDESKIPLPASKAVAVLTDIRKGLQQIQQDTALQVDERGEVTRKWLAYLQWPGELIDELLGPNFLGREGIETAYDANHLPPGINLPASMQYDGATRRLSISGQNKSAVITDLDSLLQDQAAQNTALIPAVERLKLQVQQIQAAPFEAETIYEGIYFPSGVNLPAAIKYDGAAKSLVVISIITESQLDDLKNQTNDQDFSAAIDRLKSVVEGIHKRMHSYVLPLHTVSLKQMPVTIPQNWAGRFFFQPATPTTDSQLTFVGFMTEVDKKALVQLAPTHSNAIEQLYQSSNIVPPNPEFIDQSLAEQLIFEKQTPQDRFAIILGKLLPYLREQLQNDLLIEKISTAFGLEELVTERLLFKLQYPINSQLKPVAQTLLASDYAKSDAKVILTRNGFEQQFNALELMYKAGVIISRLGFQNKQVDRLFDGTWQGLPNLSELPLAPITGSGQFPQWVNLAMLAQLPKKLPGGEATLEKIADLLNQNPAPVSNDSFRNALADRFNWAPSDFKLLLGSTGLDFSSIDDFKQPHRLSQLADCLAMILKLGSTAEMAIDWKKAELTIQDAMAARQLVRARYDQATWYQLAQPLQNKLRQKRRTALLDYLIAREKVRDANDLFGKYLIDPEMGDCMMTTRILQATGAVQLFIHRCLMGLENGEFGVSPSAINKERWQWMKNYRVWEANRKVFFYPENWIEPELRDDKSPFFQELESELLQGDINRDTAEKAFLNYIEKLEQVARLEIAAVYHQNEADGTDIVHVFGRTFNNPHVYYYRRLMAGGRFWTAWEKIDLDIEGDHLIPVVWKRRLRLFWPIFSEVADEPETLDSKGAKPDKIWHLQMAWSEYRGNKWSGKQLADPADPFKVRKLWDESAQKLARPQKAALSFRTAETSNSLEVTCRYNVSVGWVPIGKWSFIDLQSQPEVKETTLEGVGAQWHALPSNTKPYFMKYRNDVPPRTLFFPGRSSDGRLGTTSFLLLKAPGSFKIVYPHQYEFYVLEIDSSRVHSPFFFQDDRRTYFVRPFLWNEKPLQHFVFFEVHFHPYVHRFVESLNQSGIDGLLTLSNQRLADAGEVFWKGQWLRVPFAAVFLGEYDPHTQTVAAPWLTKEDVDFNPHGAYSQYNWELFFHIPFIVATHLAKNQRFEEARQWFHYVFDPTDDSQGAEPARFWRFRPFHENAVTTPIQRLAQILATDDSQLTPEERQEKQNFDLQVRQWLENPFKPHAVARWRNRAYMFSVVMKYLDNLITWGDQLFRRDTRESLNEALQIYVLAAQILGRKPESVPRRTRPQTQSYSDIRGRLDRLSNILVAAENVLAPSNSPGQVNTALSAMPSLLFCVPENPKIMEYYDKVADRLFKLRNCRNIDGVERQLALFDPPIDPAVLVKAAAAGIDLSSALSDLNAPLPFYRFNVMAPKATELCAEVKSLGGALLSALEKRDAEAMALLRSKHEIGLLQQQRQVKELQVEEAKANIEALTQSLEAAQTKLTYYLGLISMVEELTIPTGPAGPQAVNLITAALDTVGKTQLVLSAVTSVINPVGLASALLLNEALTRASEALSSLFLEPQDGDTNKVPMIPAEKRQLEELKQSHDLQQRAKDYQAVAQMMSMLPDITLGIQGFTSSPVIQAQVGGTLLSKMAQLQGSFIEYESSEHAYRANLHSILAGYQRRAAEWLHQAQLARIEMEQISKQSVAATLRLKITSDELLLHDQQIENAQSVEEFMRSKYTNQELYDWMVGQISSTYFQSYQLAYDVAKRAEKAYRFELGLQDTDTNFIQFGYWDTLKKGLLAGEKLYQDLKRMEVAYLERNRREFELTKHISLAMLDPIALLKLKETGECFVNLPEALFDLDYPGHYMRRLESVSLTIPCVTGPYTGVNCTLTLLKNSVRKSSNASGDYKDDSLFVDNIGAIQSIATSSAQNDSGVFELNFRDERYLPFEGAGAISSWRIELSKDKDLRQFDYDTISDVVFHVKYTARDGGDALKTAATDTLRDMLFPKAEAGKPQVRLFSARHEFPNEWHKFLHPKDTDKEQTLQLELTSERFPFQFQTKTIQISQVELFLKLKDEKNPASSNGKTYLEEYAAGNALKISLKPSGVNGLLESSTAFLGGIPHAEISVTNTVPAAFAFEASDADIKAITDVLRNTVEVDDVPHYHLKPEVIDDIFVVCHYSVTK